MKFIVVDDNYYKRERICNYIRKIVDNPDIIEFCCGREILFHLREIRRNDDKDIICKNTMLFLDWNFPFYKNEYIEPGEGNRVLAEIDRQKLNIPTVIVSSDDVQTKNYDFILGTIKDNDMIWQISEYQKLIPKDLHKIEKKNDDLER